MSANVTRAEYDRLARVNWSTLKHLARSPAHYRHRLVSPEGDTDSKKKGRAAHVAVFEPELFAAHYPVWDEGRRAGKLWDAFRKKHAGAEILTEKEADWCLAIQRAVRDNPVSGKYVRGGKGEVTVLWENVVPAVSDLPELRTACKARLDYVRDDCIVDLKTTRTASQAGFGAEVWRYSYHAQAAMYVDGYEAMTGKRLPYVLVAVEVDEPHIVQVYTVPDRILDLGREHYRGLLQTLEWCRREDTWPGYSDDVLELELPRWATFDDEDDDLSGFGLDLGESDA